MTEGNAPTGVARAAQHCEELLSNSLETVDVAGDFTRFGTRLARALQPKLAALLDVRKLETELVGCDACDIDALADTLGANMHHARFALPGKGIGVLASAKVCAMIGEFDRMLGGDGEGAPDAAVLPASANRFARQIEAELLGACIEATGRGDLAPAERGSKLDEIIPPSTRARMHMATIAVIRPGLPKLTLTFTTCETSFVQFVADTPAGQPARRRIGDESIHVSALGHVEFATTATLVDMAIPLSRIVALQVGTVLPVPIHRTVPLSIAGIPIAHGAVGALDDRVALEIHHTAFAKDN
tara:strand:- start:479 stop:1378 length:900 start_codon:yes stop_codon:yes gene_type:complete